MNTIKVTSRAFENNGMIPARFTCDGENVSPPLEISGMSAEAKSLALVMHDPDAPRSGGWTHWVKFNMKTDYKSGITNNDNKITIEEGKEPEGMAGKGTGGSLAYQGPCPPSGTHRYFFKIFALDKILNLPAGSSKEEFELAASGHIIDEGELLGLYRRQ